MYVIKLFKDKQAINFHSEEPLKSVLSMFSEGVFYPENQSETTLFTIYE